MDSLAPLSLSGLYCCTVPASLPPQRMSSGVIGVLFCDKSSLWWPRWQARFCVCTVWECRPGLANRVPLPLPLTRKGQLPVNQQLVRSTHRLNNCVKPGNCPEQSWNRASVRTQRVSCAIGPSEGEFPPGVGEGEGWLLPG